MGILKYREIFPEIQYSRDENEKIFFNQDKDVFFMEGYFFSHKLVIAIRTLFR